jgi:hypothetical protein
MELIFLHGRGAVGKLTVGQALQAQTGLPLFHNHLVVDAVLAVFPFGSPEFAALRHNWWLSMFEAAAKGGRSLIFTFAPEPSVLDYFVEEVASKVAKHGGRVRFVRLVCDEEIRHGRIEAPSRSRWRKLNSLAKARAMTQLADTYPPLTAELTLDTGVLGPDEAAAQIADFFGLRPPDADS